jgi:hypothetical protein
MWRVVGHKGGGLDYLCVCYSWDKTLNVRLDASFENM